MNCTYMGPNIRKFYNKMEETKHLSLHLAD
jgi:hypothetical protein